ncbi:MAG: FkbM family methyltransferase [Clostridia bacterium]|nr:FkbM family methyltransferase [Clostridia bacterium]
MYEKCSLPEYPVSSDVWQELKEETRPIVIYGMGNGADKLLSRFGELGISAADIFASDGFVRGHSYRGMRVKSFTEIKTLYDDFVIVVSFASNKADVVELIEKMDSEYDLYMPDMPIADTSEYFDRDFYNANYENIRSAYDSLYDEESKSCFAAVVSYKLTGKVSYLSRAYSSTDEMYALMSARKVNHALDVGAYNGDTVKEMLNYFKDIKRIIAIEPDRRNFKKLQKFSDGITGVSLEIINAAAYKESGEGVFSVSGNRNSSISSTESYQHKAESVEYIRIDDLHFPADYIKYDVEGAEYGALLGSMQTLEKYRPMLLVSLYHRSRDIFFLINYLKESYPEHRFYLRRLRCLPAWELNLIVI